MSYDNLKVGDWVVCTEWKHYEEYEYQGEFRPKRNPPISYSGIPAEVLAIGIPFISIRPVNGEQSTIDLREYSIVKVNIMYVSTFSPEPIETANGKTITPTKKEKKNRICPECGDRMCEHQKEGKWHLLCKHCGFLGRVHVEMRGS